MQLQFSALIELGRPRQWTKNIAVFAGIIFAGELINPVDLVRVCVAFVALCCVSAGLYAINDAVDVERDREHPVKCARPVASGRVSRGVAFGFGGVLVVVGLSVAFVLGLPFFAATSAYLLLQLAYSLWLKNVAIVDMLVIAAGFVLRAVAGALVISVAVSPWLVICAGLLALFLAAAKRRHEVLLLKGSSAGHRPVLAEYSPELMDAFMVTLSAATISCYALYTFFEQRSPGHSMMFTIPFVVYAVLRYQMLALQRESGGQPEEVLLRDRPTLVCVVGWAGSAMFVLYLLPLL